MVSVKFFGIARLKFKEKEIFVDCKTVNELLQIIVDRYGITQKEAKQFLIYVNEVNILELKKYKTVLNDGDKIMFLSPSSGG